MNWYPHHIGDYKAATAHLTNDEDLAYRRLIEMYYDTEQNIPLDTQRVSRRLRMGLDIIESVLSEFFFKSENGYTHARCDHEIAEFHRKGDIARANGKKGGRRKATPSIEKNPAGNQLLTDSLPNANLSLTKPLAIQEPVSSIQEPINTDTSTKLTSKTDYDKYFELFNSSCTNLPSVKVRSDARKTLIKDALKIANDQKKSDETEFDYMERVFKYANESAFLTGKKSNNGWVADFDFILRKKSFAKIIEGSYD